MGESTSDFLVHSLVPEIAVVLGGIAFCVAYVVTRPVGASVADWLSVSSARGGLALGTGPVSLVLAAAIAGFVFYLTRTGRDTPPDQDGQSHEPTDRGVYMEDGRQAERSTA